MKLLLKRLWRFYLRAWMYAGLVVGPVMLVLAVGFATFTVRFLHTAHYTSGRVIDLKRNVDDDGNESFAPVFQYIAGDGKTYAIESHMYSNPPGFDVGQDVEVRYTPEDPESARITTYGQTWGMETTFAILGIVFGAIGLWLRRWFRRKPRFVELSRPSPAH